MLLAGNGPLNIQVALELARAGAEVLAVAELAPKPGPWALPALGRMLTSTPALAWRGLRQVAELKRRGAAMLHGSVLSGVTQIAGGLRAEVRPWPAADGARVFEVDAVAMGYGFQPSNEILRALGCAHRFDPARGHLVTERDAEGRTTIPEIYAVGDCAGLGGALAAEAEGVIAGLAAARSLGFAPSAGQQQAGRGGEDGASPPSPLPGRALAALRRTAPPGRARPAGYADLPLRGAEPRRDRGGNRARLGIHRRREAPDPRRHGPLPGPLLRPRHRSPLGRTPRRGAERSRPLGPAPAGEADPHRRHNAG